MSRFASIIRWLAAILALSAAPIPVWMLVDWTVRNRLDAARAAFGKEGYPIALRELFPDEIPDEQNAAVPLEQAAQTLASPDPSPPDHAAGHGANPTGASLFGIAPPGRAATIGDRVDKISELLGALRDDEQRLEQIRPTADALLESTGITELLDLAREASARPRLRPRLDYTQGPRIMSEHPRHLRQLVRLLSAHTAFAIRSGGSSDAIWADILATDRLASLAQQPPTLIDALTSIACSGMVDVTIAEALSAGVLPPDTINVIDHLAARAAESLERLPRAASGERILYSDWMTNWILTTESSFPEVLGSVSGDPPLPGWAARLPKPVQRTWLLHEIVDHYTAQRTLLHILSTRPRREWQQSLADLTTTSPDTVWLAPVAVVATVSLTDTANEARRYCTIAALAACLHRSRHSAWPDSLEAMGLPDPVLIDPCSGAPLRYLVEPGRLIVYAFGPDSKDDGGQDWQRGPDRSIMHGDIVVALKLSR